MHIFKEKKHVIKFIIIIIIMSAFAGLLYFGLNHKLKSQTASEIKEYLVQNEYWNNNNMIISEDFSTLAGVTNNHWSVFSWITEIIRRNLNAIFPYCFRELKSNQKLRG